ncbi:2-polyprenyl-3-methyl-6-methoxy-1,4-benzoquinone monooxygenase [Facilibium subflavum]|uniref:2-polyprenyl-3-methyl-6-methoxy-1,4-benzoquinone monooxygenase n=1 Tax=Facilibium subflavum TaxID=2219058 RepID=UPI000E65393F|nr:2-polyprenyl-3-methyl-6-methoxy-1,4-benzoquinone monooxygenase [Facilibium subflavum]
MFRKFSIVDRLVAEVDHFVKILTQPAAHPTRNSPAEGLAEPLLTNKQQAHVAGLIRVDHTGEICAQALYRGQGFVAKDETTRAHLYQAADEEYDHLSWCEGRLNDLMAKKSLLNPLWYLNSFMIGATAGMISDKISYGFVIETENQVMKHLESHLMQLPQQDEKSRVILEQMHKDEAEHADHAQSAGGVKLPVWAKLLMKAQSKVMTTVAYRI